MVHLLHIGDVHGAALALAVTGFLAEQLRHGALGIRAAGNRMAVAAVGGGEIVLRLDGGEGTSLCGLLSDAQVDIAREHTLGEALRGLLFEGTDPNHRPVKLHQLLFCILLVCSQCSHAFLVRVVIVYACRGLKMGTSSSSSN